MKISRTVSSTIILTIMCLSLSCTRLELESSTENETESISVTETPSPILENINPLTGQSGYNPEAKGKRPVAVMVNNLKDALPQYGIEQADILYEIVVEGGITRLMAVYPDFTDVPNVCTVRSCRYYYPILAYGMDAIYLHWGADSTIATDTLKRLKIDNIDGYYSGYELVFFRDEDRMDTYAIEHTGYLKGDTLPYAIDKLNIRTDIDKANSGTAFKFRDENSPKSPDGEVCNSAVLNFSDKYFSTFEYDKERNVYTKLHSGSPHMDGVTGNQLSYTNVFVLKTTVSQRPSSILMDVGLTGGTGYYISNGVSQEIIWEKPTEASPILYSDLNGEELEVNTGKSYIGIIGNSCPITISG